MFKRIPFERVHWVTSSFLIGTLFLSLITVPLYIWHFGIDWFQIVLFFVMISACGFSITLGYHRMFSHLAFQGHWLVRALVLIFGAGAFENSALMWSSEHRVHHKHVDHDEDPYDISKGLFHAHMGWLMFKLKGDPDYSNVPDLKKDWMVMLQHKYTQQLAVLVAFVLPTVIGYIWGGWRSALGALVIGGFARVVALQHATFCINSLCHYIGKRPYSSRCSARDSFLLAVITGGEGYHNYHHEFQHDYRNGVKPWQFDPTKWIIWTLSQVGLTSNLRRVPDEKILLAELAEAQRHMETKLECPHLPVAAREYIASAYARLQATATEWAQFKDAQMEITREMLAELRAEVRAALASLRLPEHAIPTAAGA
ncbi:MAG: fatty acid desaturase [Chthoniobacter sp.]|uniref:acyl-CoA desaturase n=1 Tax=Chthoniobacter sp. TaxID=2510640 RepID=UPI0032A73055